MYVNSEKVKELSLEKIYFRPLKDNIDNCHKNNIDIGGSRIIGGFALSSLLSDFTKNNEEDQSGNLYDSENENDRPKSPLTKQVEIIGRDDSSITIKFQTVSVPEENKEHLIEALNYFQCLLNKGEIPNTDLKNVLNSILNYRYEYPADHVFYKENTDYPNHLCKDEHPDEKIRKMTAYEFYEHMYGPLRDNALISVDQFKQDEKSLYGALGAHCSRAANLKLATISPPLATDIVTNRLIRLIGETKTFDLAERLISGRQNIIRRNAKQEQTPENRV